MASGAVDPINNPQAWSVVTVGGQVSPGIAFVTDFKSKHEWDVKKGKGVFGATITYVGRPPATGSIKFMLWLPVHFQQWETFRDAFKYDATKKQPQAVDIYHPALADVGLLSFVCEGIGMIVEEGEPGSGLYSCSVDLLEFFPPPPAAAIGTPTTSQSTIGPPPNNKPGTPADPIGDAQQKQIQSLLGTATQP